MWFAAIVGSACKVMHTWLLLASQCKTVAFAAWLHTMGNFSFTFRLSAGDMGFVGVVT